ncbi:S1/P1 nuclease [Bradyrhizobium sp. UFLA01-814]|uniref:S1/P1 nuclease n=1 Tax=Bradyrhizobium sp. UFLA01-814 TaxID=3023480 RepID=UPI00398AA18F
MTKGVVAIACALYLLFANDALAWNANGHQIVGAIADEMLHANAKQQVAANLGVDLRTAGPWLDCVKSVHHFADGTFHYVVEPAYEESCKPFASAHPVMQQYVKRNFVQCSYLTKRTDDDKKDYLEEMGCHNTYHFDDVAIQRDHFDRNFRGTNDHDIVAAITAAIDVLLDRPSPPPFKIADKREALFMLAHLVGDLHQPLHVGAVYLDKNGGQVDPDATYGIDPATDTIGGNIIQDNGKNFHGDWDAPPTGLKVEQALDLLPQAKAVPPDNSRIEEWPVAWATDTIKVAPQAFAGAVFARPPGQDAWSVTFPDHAAYVQSRDIIKRQQLAKAGARLANLLNQIWP